MSAIEIFGLTKDYLRGFWRQRPHRALDRLELKVEAGEVFGLVGPNGAGKSTVLKLLMRIIYPSAGSARLLGRPFDEVEVHRRIGFLPEAPYFYDYLSAREFLNYCGQLFGLLPQERRRRIGQLLEQVGLVEAADIALRHFSRGMLQRVGLAQALINDPDLIFLDEPMLGLDPVGRREVRELILRLRAAGKTICFSTHVLPDVESLCDRVAILNRGRLHGLGRLDEILKIKIEANEVLVGQATPQLEQALRGLADELRIAGDKLAVTVPQEKLYQVIDCVRQRGGRLFAVQPVRPSLEDYFFQEFGTEKVLELTDRS